MGKIHKSHSLLHDITFRELYSFKGRKRPFFSYSSTAEDEEEDEPSSSSRAFATAHDGASTPPLSVSFAKTVKNTHILGVTDEEGYVSLFNTRSQIKPSAIHHDYTDDAIVSKWVAHDNSVYDICWIKDDAHILTASADHTIKLWDVDQKRNIAVLRGHMGSVKSLSCHPTNSDLIISGSRDGSFALWDLRCNPSQGKQWITPSEQVNGAHTTAKRKRFVKGKAASMTVTSVLYLKDEVSIATAGAVDSMVKFWDTRNLRAPTTQASPHQECTTENSGRPHGITSLSQDLNGVMLSASCTDNRIYLYNVLQLQKGPISSFTGGQITSFFVKSAISPDASHILSGSGDGDVYIWQVNNSHHDPITLSSHEREVTAVDWCPHEEGKIATASDDFTVRYWTIQNKYSPMPIARRRVMAAPITDFKELPLGRQTTSIGCFQIDGQSTSNLGDNGGLEQETGSAVLMKTPPAVTSSQCRKHGLLSGVDLTEAFNKTPEAPVRSPSSVLTPPSSTKKRTIRDYFLAC